MVANVLLGASAQFANLSYPIQASKDIVKKTFLLDFLATGAERWSSSVNDRKLSHGAHTFGRECKCVLSIGV